MKNRKTPMRRCIGCVESKPKNSLIRVADYEETLTLDPTGKAKGRGVYLCRDTKCMELARKKRSMQRSFGRDIPKEELDRIYQELEAYEQEGN